VMTVEAMEPRPGADENAADEILRAIVSIGRASVGVVWVVTVGANWRWTNIDRANSDGNRHLRVSPAHRKNK
jgi:hypothetical protein